MPKTKQWTSWLWLFTTLLCISAPSFAQMQEEPLIEITNLCMRPTKIEVKDRRFSFDKSSLAVSLGNQTALVDIKPFVILINANSFIIPQSINNFKGLFIYTKTHDIYFILRDEDNKVIQAELINLNECSPEKI